MQQTGSIWERDDLQVVVVSFETAEELQGLADSFRAPFHFVSDPERRLYELYGTIGGEWWRPFAPANVWFYFRGLFGKEFWRRPRRKGRDDVDWKQLGGDYIVDEKGRVLLAHPSQNPADRPSVETLLSVLAR